MGDGTWDELPMGVGGRVGLGWAQALGFCGGGVGIRGGTSGGDRAWSGWDSEDILGFSRGRTWGEGWGVGSSGALAQGTGFENGSGIQDGAIILPNDPFCSSSGPQSNSFTYHCTSILVDSSAD